LELDLAIQYWARLEQQKQFAKEIDMLLKGESFHKRNPMQQLNPFVDNNAVIRVGGRLDNSKFSYDVKHPIILPKTGRLTELVIEQAHQATLHAGTQLCTSFIRQRYWVMDVWRAVRAAIHTCVTCIRYSKRTAEQLMGNLPVHRVTMQRAFQSAGVDYAGPISIKARAGRSKIIEKGYLAIFVCTATKAIHVEVVSDLTALAFLSAFVRFTARRGHCSHLYSDNGTTFVGANREMGATMRKWQRNLAENELAAMSTTWHFIAPGAPWQGGLWEAGVKSVKHHLRRVMKNQIFTFEALATISAQVEEVLNSRPITAATDDPRDITTLTQPLTTEPTEQPVDKRKLLRELLETMAPGIHT
jgi:hypothetical protein